MKRRRTRDPRPVPRRIGPKFNTPLHDVLMRKEQADDLFADLIAVDPPRITPEQDARAALAMIRECIETMGPPGILPSREQTEPTMTGEAEAICEALRKLLR